MSLPGIELSSSILVGTTKPVDSKYGPFTGNTLAAAKTEALTNITAGFRFEGLTAGLIVTGQDIVEYQFKGGIADSNFVQKSGAAGSIDVEKGGTSVVTTNTLNYKGLFKITDNNGVGDITSSNFAFTVGAGSATATWNINHNLDKYPAVVAVNTSNEEIFGDLTYVDKNNVTIAFKSAVAGFAYLN
tara:strand:+ start:2025 stop:2585 length:561 start_codon:yes stop_codon:yes gene_type:complete